MNTQDIVFYNNIEICNAFLISKKCKRSIFHIDDENGYFLEFPNIVWNINYFYKNDIFIFKDLRLVGFDDELNSFKDEVYSFVLPNTYHDDQYYGYVCMDRTNEMRINNNNYRSIIDLAEAVIEIYWSSPFSKLGLRLEINQEIIHNFYELRNKLNENPNPKISWYTSGHHKKTLMEFAPSLFYRFEDYEQLGLPLFPEKTT